MAIAYDYEAQVWVDGERGDALIAEQRAEHEALLSDPWYREMLGPPSK